MLVEQNFSRKLRKCENIIAYSNSFVALPPSSWDKNAMSLGVRFSKDPVTNGPEIRFWNQISGKIGCVLNSNRVHFVSLANNFTV